MYTFMLRSYMVDELWGKKTVYIFRISWDKARKLGNKITIKKSGKQNRVCFYIDYILSFLFFGYRKNKNVIYLLIKK